MNYRCKHCGHVIKINNTKKWIKSYCYETDKSVRLTIVTRDKK